MTVNRPSTEINPTPPVIASDLGGRTTFFETDSSTLKNELLARLNAIIKDDKANGGTWDKFGGIVVTPEIIPRVIESGLITQQQINEATARGESTIPFQANKIFDMFNSETDNLVSDDHAYYQRNLIIMNPVEVNKKYGDYVIVTVDTEGQML